MSPRTLLRTAALNALAQAASAADANVDFAPLVGAQVFLGQSWPSQSPPPGAGPMPNQVLIYLWNEKSETSADRTTAPQFETTVMLVIEARVETRTPAAEAALPATPATTAIAAAIDGLLEALTYAVKDAVCRGIQVAAMNLNPSGRPIIEGIQERRGRGQAGGDGATHRRQWRGDVRSGLHRDIRSARVLSAAD